MDDPRALAAGGQPGWPTPLEGRAGTAPRAPPSASPPELAAPRPPPPPAPDRRSAPTTPLVCRQCLRRELHGRGGTDAARDGGGGQAPRALGLGHGGSGAAPGSHRLPGAPSPVGN